MIRLLSNTELWSAVSNVYEPETVHISVSSILSWHIFPFEKIISFGLIITVFTHTDWNFLISMMSAATVQSQKTSNAYRLYQSFIDIISKATRKTNLSNGVLSEKPLSFYRSKWPEFQWCANYFFSHTIWYVRDSGQRHL